MYCVRRFFTVWWRCGSACRQRRVLHCNTDRVKFSRLFAPFNSWREGTTVVLAIHNYELLADMDVMKLGPALTASAAEISATVSAAVGKNITRKGSLTDWLTVVFQATLSTSTSCRVAPLKRPSRRCSACRIIPIWPATICWRLWRRETWVVLSQMRTGRRVVLRFPIFSFRV